MIDMKVINNFIENESLSGTDKILKDKCLEADSALRAASEDANKLQQQLSAKNAEVARLNGILEGYLVVIQEAYKE